MSAANVDLVRGVYDAVARRDFEAVMAHYAEDVEWDFSHSPASGVLGGDRFHGHDGLRRFWQMWGDAWETYEDSCEELSDAGDRVITVGRSRGRGRASGAELDLRQYGVWTVEDGKITRVVWFISHEAALREAGIASP